MTENNVSRLLSLDVFRGLTVAAMVLVNNPGTWSAVYAPLKHADWHGVTPTDFVFPFFLFIVGISITFALGKRVENGTVNNALHWKIIKRGLLIFGIGLFLMAFPKFDFGQLRIMGVLQRIAICYVVAALLFVHTNWRTQTYFAAALLFIYWALMTFIPVPGCEIATIDDKACNLSAYLDRMILGANHIYKGAKVYDPEGFLSTIPAISTCLAGVLCGHWLRSRRDDLAKVSGMFFFGVVLTVIGWFWNLFFPLNKPLWTSSYVVYTAGLALCALAACYWLVDIQGYRRWTKPFVIFGVNALALYAGSSLLARILINIPVQRADGKNGHAQTWIFDTFFAPLASPINASLIFGITYIFFWLLLMWLLYRKNIVIKV